MIQYHALVLFGVENHHMALCMHPYIFACIYFVCDFGAIILCVDFGANSDCDCEDCSLSKNYQGKCASLFIPMFFNYALEIFARLAWIFLIYMLCLGNPSSCRIARNL